MISVTTGPDELRAAVALLRAADRTLRRDINQDMRATMNPVWREALAHNYVHATPAGARVIDAGARIAPGNPPVLYAANSKRKVTSGGLIPDVHWQAFEFGADQDRRSTYTRRSRNGGTHQVTRRTGRALPSRRKAGHVIYPAVREVGPRLASYFVQSVVRTYMDIMNPR